MVYATNAEPFLLLQALRTETYRAVLDWTGPDREELDHAGPLRTEGGPKVVRTGSANPVRTHDFDYSSLKTASIACQYLVSHPRMFRVAP